MAVALEAFCLMTFQMLCGRKKKAPSNFSINLYCTHFVGR